jgi:hypothetical protein
VVTAEVPWLDSLLADALEPLEGSLALEDVPVGVSELVVGVLELVEVLVPLELGEVSVLLELAVFFVARAGSWPEASWT